MKTTIDDISKEIKHRYDIDLVFEHRFHQAGFIWDKQRRWRLDAAIPAMKIAIEIEGGVYTKGRHTNPMGFMKDMEKYNTLAAMGWRLIRCGGHNIEELLKYLPVMIEQEDNNHEKD
jgi:very-short-patch-repair endonuclease